MLDQIFEIFKGLILVKIGFLILNGLYLAFLLVVYKQSRAMQRVVNDGSASSIVNSFALLNVILGILLFVAALVIL
ncbi:MAG: hypothetical protein US51_C0036G0009 [Microgenomates group bacterium GW2011_GWA2_37_6]|nr:MAG: hypothetical protein US51_C0036G0009 [Microgenomates group bacterium GW2011_GWA2_37_6]